MVKTLRGNKKTAPLFHKKTSQYTSQCDKGNITFVVCIIKIKLFKGDGRFSGEPAMQG
jgi:hypothetical protein